MFEDDAVLAVLAGSDANRCDCGTNARVPQNVVGAGWLLHPPGLQFGKFAGALDRFVNAPLLVRIHHQLVGPANLFSYQAAAANVVLRMAANLELEMGPALGQGFVA